MAGTTQRPGTPTPSSVATFVLSLLTVVATMTAVVLWSPIDLAFVSRADDAGDPGLLLPNQHLLWLAVIGAAAISLALTVVSLLAVFASRRTPDRLRTQPAPEGPRVWTA
jgi:hypothetical protein